LKINIFAQFFNFTYMESPLSYFSVIKDPRIDRTKAHLLEDIIVIAILSVLCGADTWNDMEGFGKAKEAWLRTFLKLPEGIPSHDTFNRVFSLLDPKQLQDCFIQWTSSVARLTEGEVISIDGKAICGSRDKNKKSIVHMVSAWAGVNNIVLAQVKVDDKSNEITAIPELLKLLVLKGCIVTIDAMGCQRDIAEAIISGEADYILALKGNQGNLLEQTEDSFRFLKAQSVSDETDAGHGRVERRICTVINDLSMIEQKEQWKNLQSLVRIEAERYIKSTGKTENEIRYYISSLPADASLLNRSIRSHWGIENSLHWTLDVAFNEDNSRKREGNAAQNFSVLSRIALNLLKNEKTTKCGVKGKRLKAGWDNKYLQKILRI
jgi:predicted transposase YbfD/YdcC